MRSRRLASLMAVAALAPGLASTAASDAQSSQRAVSWSIAAEPAGGGVRAGGRVVLAITVAIEEGWHVYGTEELPGGPRALRLTLLPGQPAAAGRLEAPEPSREFDAAFEQVTTFYDKTTTFRLPVTISSKASPGKLALVVEASFQACDGRICLPGRTVKLTAAMEVRAGRGR